MLGPSCKRYNWQTGRCGSMAFGSSPRRGKTLISNPRCLAEVSTCGKIMSGAPKGGLMSNSDLSGSFPRGKGTPADKARLVSTLRRVPTNWVSGRTLQPSIESVVASSFVPSDFLVDGQVSGLGTVHPLLTLNFFSTCILPIHVASFYVFSSLILCTKPFGD